MGRVLTCCPCTPSAVAPSTLFTTPHLSACPETRLGPSTGVWEALPWPVQESPASPCLASPDHASCVALPPA